MLVCKDCGSPAKVEDLYATHGERLTMLRYRVTCATCPERAVDSLPVPVRGGNTPI